MKTLTETIKELMLSNIDGLGKEDDRYFLENDAIPSAGSIGGLIYYSETEELAKEYHDEIIDLMEEYGVSNLSLNDMAWFAYEAISHGLIDEVLESIEYEEED